ncbi:hypothetical protein AGMMS49944_22150 [Spirochaetia bacterium]|nr:hypothetical protein AGMMS49944_22150 [Spirochaetia bacterium]
MVYNTLITLKKYFIMDKYIFIPNNNNLMSFGEYLKGNIIILIINHMKP